MTQPGRDRPISYEKARTLLLERLAANRGIKFTVSTRDWDDGAVLDNTFKFSDETMAALWEKAKATLDNLIFGGVLAAWIADGDRWTHVTGEALFIAHSRTWDDRSGLFVDRAEFETAAADSYPKELSNFGSTAVLANSDLTAHQAEPPKRRGRPQGSGPYSKSDLPLLDEMAELMEADPSLSATDASLTVAPRAGGTKDVAHRAKRLERKFKAMRNNGS